MRVKYKDSALSITMRLEDAPDIKECMEDLVEALQMKHIDTKRIVCMRSSGSKGRALARIWSLPKIWQNALGVEAHYVVEVISEKFDKLSEEEKHKTLIHEILHIPKNFSGAVVSHRTKHFDGLGGHKTVRIDERTVDRMYREIKHKLK